MEARDIWFVILSFLGSYTWEMIARALIVITVLYVLGTQLTDVARSTIILIDTVMILWIVSPVIRMIKEALE